MPETPRTGLTSTQKLPASVHCSLSGAWPATGRSALGSTYLPNPSCQNPAPIPTLILEASNSTSLGRSGSEAAGAGAGAGAALGAALASSFLGSGFLGAMGAVSREKQRGEKEAENRVGEPPSSGLYPAWTPHAPSPTPTVHNRDRAIKGHWPGSGAILGPGEGIVQAQEWVWEREGCPFLPITCWGERGRGGQRPLLNTQAHPQMHTSIYVQDTTAPQWIDILNRCRRLAQCVLYVVLGTEGLGSPKALLELNFHLCMEFPGVCVCLCRGGGGVCVCLRMCVVSVCLCVCMCVGSLYNYGGRV